MSNIVTTQAAKLGAFFGMEGNGDELVQILKATAFKGQVSDAQMAALMVVANQYKLNPFTKELFAFPDKNNGIVPVVGVDGWARIINNNEQFDGIEFDQDEKSCTCKIYRKDRSHATSVTEYMDECRRGTGPWQSHPRRMLRHKAMIQAARLAFGYGGIYDQDEAERIVEKDITADVVVLHPEPPSTYPEEHFKKALAKWRESGTRTPNEFIALLSSKAPLTEAQKAEIRKGRNTDQPSNEAAAQNTASGGMTEQEIADALARERAEAQGEQARQG